MVSTVTEDNQTRRQIVATNITAARVAAELSKRRLAREAGVLDEQLYRWEGAVYEPSAANLLKLSHVLGQSLEWFYESHDDESPDAVA
jgi:transcriptional regulator with XRE-family HTH domain